MSGQNLYDKNNNRFKTILLSYSRRPEKFFLVFFVVGLLALGLGVWYSRNTIRKPFIIANNDQVVTEADNQQALDNFAELLNNQQKDTDGDTLPDSFETDIYKTSPYLKDTDSDGLDDNVEIANGTNPNCPEGKDCSVIAPTTSVNPADLLTSTGVITDEYAASLRLVLEQVGIEKSVLDALSNQELVDLYNKTIAETNTDSSIEQELVAGNLSPAGLRQLLLQGGIDQAVLDQISDDELLQVYDAVLAQEYAEQIAQ